MSRVNKSHFFSATNLMCLQQGSIVLLEGYDRQGIVGDKNIELDLALVAQQAAFEELLAHMHEAFHTQLRGLHESLHRSHNAEQSFYACKQALDEARSELGVKESCLSTCARELGELRAHDERAQWLACGLQAELQL